MNAKEVLVIAPQSRRRLVEKVHYVTCPGRSVTTLVTDMGILQKQDDEFILTDYFSEPTPTSQEDVLARIRQNCGWELKKSSQLAEIPAPSLDELVLLRTFDPEGYFTR